jgi:hypothetical protein
LATTPPIAGSPDHQPAADAGGAHPASSVVAAPPRPTPTNGFERAQAALRAADIRRAERLTTLAFDVPTDRLGAIRLEATRHQSALHVTLAADQAATRDLLNDQVDALRHELADRPGVTVSVDVSDPRHGARGGRQPMHQPGHSTRSSSPAPASPDPRPVPDRQAPGRSTAGGRAALDLML